MDFCLKLKDVFDFSSHMFALAGVLLKYNSKNEEEALRQIHEGKIFLYFK